uniref:Odorant-binding protein n=1 Tax=Anopheles funestus TaxID=62324 RepID=A0A182RV54_ANOFN
MGTNRIGGALGWLLLLAATCTVTLAAPSTGHGYETKSIAQAYLECLQYLNISRQSMYEYNTTAVPLNNGGNCLLRCIGLNTRWWNDEAGLNEKALLQFFRQTDTNSLEQARTCLAEVSDSPDTCAAAYRSFRCYSDALGDVIAHPEYVAPCREEIQRSVSDCAAMLQVSDEQLTSCVNAETFQHSGNATALLRCVVLRLGLYADSTGVMYDRLQLLMDSDTAPSWTEAHVEEAKQCENNLRALGAEVCQVAAHSVEICYGWQAFGELWKVLTEEYGSSYSDILYDHTDEPLMESNDVTEEKQEQANNDIYRVPKEVEVFSYPSGSRYRSLLILNPKWNVGDSKSDSSDSSSSQDDKTPSDDKLTTPELSVMYSKKPVNPDNVVQQQTVPEVLVSSP